MFDFVNELPRMIGSTLGSWTSPLPFWLTPVVALLAVLGIRGGPDEQTNRPSLALAVAIGCGGLLLATHRAPFVRVWLFLLPLFLMSVARGTRRMLSRVAQLRDVNGRWIPLGIAVALSAAALVTHSAERSDDTGTFRPAREVTALLAPKLRPGDRVLAPIPAIGPLLYYFPFAGADTVLLTVPKQFASRVFLVLDTPHGQSLEWAVASGVIDPRLFAQPTLLARYADGEVWEAARR
jgi:hypothetical protein